MKPVLKLGTRRSLLAWAQSSWVAREVERANPGLRIELVGIETRGDKIQDVPLTSVQGKEFFVAEIDAALKSGEVDLTVHSLKDLSLDRPSEFVSAATPRRENPRDVVLYGPRAIEHLQQGRALKIGTSSPRRLENIPPFLKKALPRFGSDPRLEFLEIRGNINTRLSRVHLPLSDPKYLDAVVLAFAGIIRLWRDEPARNEAAKLFEGIRWMVLPLRECPSAPGQGALAIECRANDSRVREAIGKIHDPESMRAVSRERELLAEWGGGCHQRFGATLVTHGELRDLFFVRGLKPNDEFVDELRWKSAALAPSTPRAEECWDGSEWRAPAVSIAIPSSVPSSKALFIAHSRALPSEWTEGVSDARIWTSGTSSWFTLAEQGVWVEGSAEGLGFETLKNTLNEPVLGLPQIQDWNVLTHEGAVSSWDLGSQQKIIATYALPPEAPRLDAIPKLKNARHIFWSSGSQFDLYSKHVVSSDLKHACGPGKTVDHLRGKGIQPLVFPDSKEWKKWLNIP